jgi:hypothetical protein
LQTFRKELEEGSAWLLEKETLLKDELPKPDLSKLESTQKPQRVNGCLVIVGPQKAQIGRDQHDLSEAARP